MRIRLGLALIGVLAVTACGGGGDDGGSDPNYIHWNGNANDTTVLDAGNGRYAVDADTRTVVALASTTNLLGLVVDDRANVVANGAAIGYVGAATSTTGARIMVFFCSDGSAMTISLSAQGWRAGCASGTGGGSGGGGGTGGGGGSASFSVNETSEINATLTGASPNFVDTSGLTLTKTTRVWAFSWAEFAAEFWVVDAANAAALKAGGRFSGFRMADAGSSGMSFVTLPAGTWYVAVFPSGTFGSGYSNRIYAELSVPTLAGATEVNDAPMYAGGNAGSWRSMSFSVGTGSRAFLETEGSGGLWAVMDPSQYSSFSAAYGGGYNGGSFSYVYACGPSSGGAALEIECELKLPPGTYYLVYVNNTGSAAGGAANIGYFQ